SGGRTRRRQTAPPVGRALGAALTSLLTGLPGHRVLPGLAVDRVLLAPAAVFLELDPVRIVPLRLVRLVIAPLALGARKGDRDSDSGCHISSLGKCGTAWRGRGAAPRVGGLQPE